MIELLANIILCFECLQGEVYISVHPDLSRPILVRPSSENFQVRKVCVWYVRMCLEPYLMTMATMAREYLFIHLDPLEENLLPHTFLRNGWTECVLQCTFCTSISQECVWPLNLVQKCLEFEGFRPFFGLRTFMSGLQ